jgi:5'-nucleotidase
MVRFLLGSALALPLAACVSLPQDPPAPVTVKVVGLNDFHGNLEPLTRPISVEDAASGRQEVHAAGAAWLASAVAEVKGGAEHSLVIAAGDLIGGSPLVSSIFLDEPAIGAMNRLGLDFNAVGNHEFDRGWRELRRIQQGGCEKLTMREPCAVENPYPGAAFRFLAANVVMPDGSTLFPAYGIKRFGTGVSEVAVGVIGLTLKDTPTLVTPSGVEGLTFGDEAEAINRAVTALEGQGVDAIVVAVHQGLSTEVGYNDKSCGGVAGPLIDILKRVDPRVDLVISGHTHRAYVCDFAKLDPARAFLVTSAGYGGSMLTDITLTIDPVAGAVVAKTADNRVVQSVGTDRAGNPVAPNPAFTQYEPDAEVAAYVARYVEAAREASERPVGRISGGAEKGGSTEETQLGNRAGSLCRRHRQLRRDLCRPAVRQHAGDQELHRRAVPRAAGTAVRRRRVRADLQRIRRLRHDLGPAAPDRQQSGIGQRWRAADRPGAHLPDHDEQLPRRGRRQLHRVRSGCRCRDGAGRSRCVRGLPHRRAGAATARAGPDH